MGGKGSGRGYRWEYEPPTEGARLLAHYLRDKDMSQQHLAGLMGYTPSTLYRQMLRANGHSLAFAFAVFRVTGRIPPEKWLQEPKHREHWLPGNHTKPKLIERRA